VTRPELSKLNRGDTLWMLSGTPGRRSGQTYSEVRVVTIGPKFVGVVSADKYDRYLADPAEWRWTIRKFLLEDQKEGARGTRYGYSAAVATAEQREYDERLWAVGVYLRDVVGVEVRANSPLRDPEVARRVASLLRVAESSWLPPAEAEASP